MNRCPPWVFWLVECACGVSNLDGLLVHRDLIAPHSQAGEGMQPWLDIGIVAAIPRDTESPSWRCHRDHYVQVGQKM